MKDTGCSGSEDFASRSDGELYSEIKENAIAYSAAFHQHKDSEAAQRLGTCLAYSGHTMPVLRKALMSDAAVFQGRRRKRTDLAEQWVAGIPVKTRNPWFRLRAEAAILEAKGDLDGALGKLAEVEAAILTLPKNAQRDTSLRLLERWKSDVCRCCAWTRQGTQWAACG